MIDRAPMLRISLRANACFSVSSGLVMVLASAPLASWLGLASGTPLLVIGCVLLAFAAHLAWASSRQIPLVEGVYFVAADSLWVLGTAVLLLTSPAALSAQGRVAALLVAGVVASLACLQGFGLLRACRDQAPALSHA